MSQAPTKVVQALRQAIDQLGQAGAPLAALEPDQQWDLAVVLGLLAGENYPELGEVADLVRAQLAGFESATAPLVEATRAALAGRSGAAAQLAQAIRGVGPGLLAQAITGQPDLREAIGLRYPEPTIIRETAGSRPTGRLAKGATAAELAPSQSVPEILALVRPRLAALKDSDWFSGVTNKFAPLDAELARLEALPDTPQNRVRARSLLTSVGGVLPETPQNLRPDSGDVYARNRTLGQEVADQAGELADQAKQKLEAVGSGLQTGLIVVGGAVLAVGLGAVLLSFATRRRPRRRRGEE